MEPYEMEIGYLSYEDSSDLLSFPVKFRERHLTPDTTGVLLQAIGTALQVSAFSERDNVTVRVPLHTWRTTKSIRGTLSGPTKGLLAVGRFEDEIANNGNTVTITVITHNMEREP